ncbi:hypothetical protein FEM48_Zijuj10G0061500 [Ziziphus jujuba var. spinosa]|uniref:SWIM-type domain-containing protein n=1 Tax=Ziziphus jujuba var. spinosa TaxID=714518 RepID=A0A978ULR9_ZIZJJ|nr:hypothetical protein FEM48_Zijuj10G0061500 [Ziziphus jujuba var. spinosa]
MLTTKEDMFGMSDEEYEDGQEIHKNLDCNEIIDAPKVGMEISKVVQRRVELNDRAGIGVAKNFQSFVVEASGHDNVPFLEKDCRNYIDKRRRLQLDRSKEAHFIVCWDKEKYEIKCACRLFEFKGILCKHSLSVLIKVQIKQVPEKYILAQWRKDLKRSRTKVRVAYDNWKGDHEAQCYHKLQKKLDDVADLTVISDENCAILLNMIDEFQSKVSKNASFLENSPSTNTTRAIANVFSHHDGEIKEIHSPLVIRRHGHPL